jgi:hypothetical protein
LLGIRPQLFQEAYGGPVCFAGVDIVSVHRILTRRDLCKGQERHREIEIGEQEVHATLI